MKLLSWILVAVQVAGIGIICVTEPPIATALPSLIVQALSLALLIWTWINLHPGKFHILPDPIRAARLVTSGPFRWIRHPMYLSLFLYLVPLVIDHFSWFRLFVLLIFTANMIFKLLYEERHLLRKFPEYEQYMKKSWRLIPFIF